MQIAAPCRAVAKRLPSKSVSPRLSSLDLKRKGIRNVSRRPSRDAFPGTMLAGRLRLLWVFVFAEERNGFTGKVQALLPGRRSFHGNEKLSLNTANLNGLATVFPFKCFTPDLVSLTLSVP